MPDDEQQDQQSVVPSARLREETAAKRKALARVAELESTLEDAEKRAATADTLARQVEELRVAHKAAAAEWESERAVYQVGITDPEAIDVARYLHGRLPEDKRPKLADWLRGLKDAPDQAPRALAPYLTPAQVQEQEEARQAAAQPAPAATRAKGGSQTTTAGASGSALSAEQIRALREEAQRTGDWTRWREAQPAIEASTRLR